MKKTPKKPPADVSPPLHDVTTVQKLPERLAYSIDEFCECTCIGRSTVYEEIKAGRLIARKARGRTVILPTDGKNYLRSLPTIKVTAPEPEAA